MSNEKVEDTLEQAIEKKDFSAISQYVTGQKDSPDQQISYQGKKQTLFDIVFDAFTKTNDVRLIKILDAMTVPSAVKQQERNITECEVNTSGKWEAWLIEVGSLYVYTRREPEQFSRDTDNKGNSFFHHVLQGQLMHSKEAAIVITATVPEVSFSKKNKDGNTVMHLAANACLSETGYMTGYNKRMRDQYFPLLLEKSVQSGFDFNLRDKNGAPLLYRIAAKGSEENILSVLEHSSQKEIINYIGKDGRTALSLAIMAGHYSAANALLIAGADPCLGQVGKKPLDIISEKMNDTGTANQSQELAALQRQIQAYEQPSIKRTFSSLFGMSRPPLIEKVDSLISSRSIFNPLPKVQHERAAFELLKIWLQRPGADPVQTLGDWQAAFVYVQPLRGDEQQVNIKSIITDPAVKKEINELYELLGHQGPYELNSKGLDVKNR